MEVIYALKILNFQQGKCTTIISDHMNKLFMFASMQEK